MNALRLYGKRENLNHYSNLELRLENVEKTKLKPSDVLLRVAYCGICGSDFHLTHSQQVDGIMDYPGLVQLPVIIGHEFSATIEDFGSNVPVEFKAQNPIGSSVTAEEMLWCGKCEPCLKGNVNHCSSIEEIGFTHDGAHSEFLAVPYQYLHSIEPLIKKYGKEKGLQMGALIEPFSVAFRALNYAGCGLKPKKTDRILIIGAGPIGMATAEIARLSVDQTITLLEISEKRKEFAQKQKFHAFNHRSDLNQEAYDWIIDAAGSTDTLKHLIINNTKASATICLLARCDEPLNIQTDLMISKNLKIYGSQGHSGDNTYQAVIQLLNEHTIDTNPYIEEIINLKEAHTRLINQTKGYGKVLVNPRIKING